METFTVAAARASDFHFAFKKPQERYLFLLRAGTLPLYVGAASNIGHYLQENLGDDPPLGAAWTRLVKRNHPASLQWQVDILTLEDCASLVEQEILSLLDGAVTDVYSHARSAQGSTLRLPL